MAAAPAGSADVIVVGGGSAGCALAARLAQNPGRQVLLLESGRDYGGFERYPRSLQRGYSAASSLPGDPNAWSYLAQLTETVTYPVTRGRLLGGSSAVNGGQFTRGTRADFDTWAALGNAQWSFEQVLPFFVRLEKDLDLGSRPWHGASGPVPVRRAADRELTAVARAFVQACLDQGHPYDDDMNAPDSIGIGLTPHNMIDGRRHDMAAAYLDGPGRPPNLRVVQLATVRRVLFDGHRACGVEAVVDGLPIRFTGEEVVLSAGGINTPHLLMLSGVGPGDPLRAAGVPVVHDLPGVGRGLMDHPAVHLTYRAEGYQPRAGTLTPSQVCLNYTSSGGGARDDMRIFPTTYSKGGMLFGMRGQSLRDRARATSFVTRPLRTWRGLRGTSRGSLLHDVRHRSDLSLYCGLDLERARGDVVLSSADPSTAPLLVHRYMSEPDDLTRMRECVRMGVDLLRSPQFRQLGVRITGLAPQDVGDDGALDRWVRTHISTAFHTSCTARMGPADDPFAVVDQQCRVHGLEGLRVVDVSIMPTLVRRGPNATAVMIGERAAALIDHSLGPRASGASARSNPPASTLAPPEGNGP